MAVIIAHYTNPTTRSAFVAWADADADASTLAAPLRLMLLYGRRMEILEYLPNLLPNYNRADEAELLDRIDYWRITLLERTPEQ